MTVDWDKVFGGAKLGDGSSPPAEAPAPEPAAAPAPRYAPAPTTEQGANERLADVAAAEEDIRAWAENKRLKKGGQASKSAGLSAAESAAAPAPAAEKKPGVNWDEIFGPEKPPAPPAPPKKTMMQGLAAAMKMPMPEPGLPGITPEQARGMTQADEAPTQPPQQGEQLQDQQTLARPAWEVTNQPLDQRRRTRFAENDPRRVDRPFQAGPGGSVLDRPDALDYGNAQDMRGRNLRAQEEGSQSPEANAAAARGQRERFTDRPYAEAKPLELTNEISSNIREATKNPAARGVVAGFSELGKVGTGVVRLAADLSGSNDVAKFAAAAEGRAKHIAEGATQDLQGNDQLVADIFSSVTNSVPSMVLGVGGGPALRTLFAQSALQEYGAGRDAGFGVGDSLTRAGIMGFAEALGERFGFSEQMKLLKSVGKAMPSNELVRTLGDMMRKEIPGEQLTTLMQFLADKMGPAAQNPNATLEDYLNAAGETLKVTVGQSLLMGGGPAVLNQARNELARADQAINRSSMTMAQRAAVDAGFTSRAVQRFMEPDPALQDAPPSERRASLSQRFGELAAEFGLRPAAAKSAQDAINNVPASEAPGFLTRLIDSFSKKGLFGKPLNETGIEGLQRNLQAAEESAAPDNQSAAPTNEGGQDGQAEEEAQGLLTKDAPADVTTAGAQDYTGLDETIDQAAHQAATSPLNDRPEPTDAQKEAGNYAKGHVRISGMDVSIENPKGSERRQKASEWLTASGRYRDGGEWSAEYEPVQRNDGQWMLVRKLSDSDGQRTEYLDADGSWVKGTPSRIAVSGVGQNGGADVFPSRQHAVNAAQSQHETSSFKPGWQVTMPGHYGYIRGTTGADGDHVDLFIGDKGDNGSFWVINQTTPDGKAFDEHKVITGVDSAAEAIELYRRSFTDGFGDKVLGSVSQRMDAGQIKALLPDMSKANAVHTPKAFNDQPDVAVPAGQVAGAGDGRSDQPGRSGGAVGPDAAAPERVGDAAAAPQAGGGAAEAVANAGAANAPLTDLADLKRRWSAAVAAGNTEEAKRINEQIVAAKAAQKGVEPAAPAPAPAPEPATAPAPAAAPEPRVIGRYGKTPKHAQPIELRANEDGTLTPFTGKYEMLDWATGDPIKLPSDVTDQQAADAIRAAGAVTEKDKFFGVKPDPKLDTKSNVAPADGTAPVGISGGQGTASAGAETIEDQRAAQQAEQARAAAARQRIDALKVLLACLRS